MRWLLLASLLLAAAADPRQAEDARLAASRVEAAARLQKLEVEIAEQTTAIAGLAAQRDRAAARLAERAAALAPLMPLVERLALFPAETLLAVPAPPDQAVRGLGILRGLTRRLEADARALRDDQAQLAEQQRAVEAALERLRAAQSSAAAEARDLDARIAAALDARQRQDAAGIEAARRAAADAARADTLRGAVTAMESARARAEKDARDDAARAERDRRDHAAADARQRRDTMARPAPPEPGAQLVPPVAGAILRAWGAPTDAGPATGVSYRPAAQARVVAPCAGRVRFGAPFRSYGLLLILDCGGGYAFVLAGLGRLDVVVGTAVLAGEPVGVMPASDAAPGNRPALYVELRRDGQAVDPGPFLRTRG